MCYVNSSDYVTNLARRIYVTYIRHIGVSHKFVTLCEEFSGYSGYMSHMSVISGVSRKFVTECDEFSGYHIADICDICVPYLVCRVNSSHYVTNLAEIVDM